MRACTGQIELYTEPQPSLACLPSRLCCLAPCCDGIGYTQLIASLTKVVGGQRVAKSPLFITRFP